jgi:hypothetical protein
MGMCGSKDNIKTGLKEMSVRVWREPLVKFMADVMVFVLVGWKTI